jgi:hypothetical protein
VGASTSHNPTDLHGLLQGYLYALGLNIITFIKLDRLKWAAHILRIDQQRKAKRIINAKPEGRMKRGKRKLRWQDGVDNVVKAVGERN